MNLHDARSAILPGSIGRRWVSYKLTRQGRRPVRLLGKRKAIEGGYVEQPWNVPSIVWHLPVANQDRQCCYPQFTGTFSQV